MYGATMRPSSGEITVSMWYCLVCRVEGNSTLYTRQSSTLSDKYQVSHRYSYFSWWWAHSRPKHVQKRNKHTKKNCAPVWFYLQDYTRMYGQQNIKFGTSILVSKWSLKLALDSESKVARVCSESLISVKCRVFDCVELGLLCPKHTVKVYEWQPLVSVRN